MRNLSELEGCVLGHLWKHGPTTAYAVRKEMQDSPSSHWSGSAGAIYPLLERLEKHKLVTSRAGARGDRAHWSYQLTGTGRKALLAWLVSSAPEDIISVAPDPLRTRMYFLAALPPTKRNAFLVHARERLIDHIEQIKAVPPGDEFDRLAQRGAVHAMRARVAWLDEVKRALSRRPPPGETKRRGPRAQS